MNKVIMPLQPIENGRFIPNRIVQKLLEAAPIDLNDISCMDFTEQERVQFAQLIGYSLGGFSDLSYVDDESYEAASKMAKGMSELAVRNSTLREQLDKAREGVKKAASVLFKIHPDDLDV